MTNKHLVTGLIAVAILATASVSPARASDNAVALGVEVVARKSTDTINDFKITGVYNTDSNTATQQSSNRAVKTNLWLSLLKRLKLVA